MNSFMNRFRHVRMYLITIFAGLTAFAGPMRAQDPAPAAVPARPGTAKLVDFLKKQQALQLEQQRQMKILIEQMQKQGAPVPDLPDPFPPVAIPQIPAVVPPLGEKSDIVIDRPGLKARSISSSTGSSYSLQNNKLTAVIAEPGVRATLQGKMVGGKMALDRIELDEPAGRKVYNSLDQVPAAARAVIGRQLIQWAKEARGGF